MFEQLAGNALNSRANEKGTLTQGYVPPLRAASWGQAIGRHSGCHP